LLSAPSADLDSEDSWNYSSSGSADPDFGAGGTATVRYGQTPSLATDPHGRVLLLGLAEFPEAVSEGQEETEELFTRLRADGSLDSGFARRGQTFVPQDRRSWLTAVGVDARSRPLLVGWALRSTTNPSWQFQLLRLTARGQVDRGFGTQGLVRTRFGAASSGGADAVMVDASGRILVGGPVRSPRFPAGYGFALARYLPGS
jgi:uncharacterized delta-60 repeat protein